MTAYAVMGDGDNRRGKAALFLIVCGCAGALPHLPWVDPGQSLLPAIALAILLGGYGLRTVFLGQRRNWNKNQNLGCFNFPEDDLPSVDVLVAARDEEAVIERLVHRIAGLDYPKDKISIWIIDDGSKDKTPHLLDSLTNHFPDLNVIHRSVNAGGGKSGALNKALVEAENDWLFILDADAQLQKDSLIRLVSYALNGGWSAIQVRKSVINSNQNNLTSCQAMEMAMDALIQEGRLASGGVVELRGNGQLIRRAELDKCGGFNEETVTDDLDLSFRLLIAGALIGIVWDPPVQEEAVTSIKSLWRQRQRWAEGGLQRFFDYWPLLISSRLGVAKRRDLACFFLLQYALPVVSFADLITALYTDSLPIYWPLSIAAFGISGIAFWFGCRRISEGPSLPSPKPWTLLLAITYLAHWFIVIPWVSIKMALLPKSLVWLKTNHVG